MKFKQNLAKTAFIALSLTVTTALVGCASASPDTSTTDQPFTTESGVEIDTAKKGENTISLVAPSSIAETVAPSSESFTEGNSEMPTETSASSLITPSPEPSYIEAPKTSDLGVKTFKLTSEEQTAYDNFKKSGDVNSLQGLSPISSVKIHINSGINREAELVYKTFYPDSTVPDHEQYIEINKKGTNTVKENQTIANAAFAKIDEGVFVETGTNEGYISYWGNSSAFNDDIGIYRVIKDENGVWRIKYSANS